MSKTKHVEMKQGQSYLNLSDIKGKRIEVVDNNEDQQSIYTVSSSKKEVRIVDKTVSPGQDLSLFDQLNIRLKKGETISSSDDYATGGHKSIMIIGRNGRIKTTISATGIDRVNVIQ